MDEHLWSIDFGVYWNEEVAGFLEFHGGSVAVEAVEFTVNVGVKAVACPKLGIKHPKRA
jgi:hypothetical protein